MHRGGQLTSLLWHDGLHSLAPGNHITYVHHVQAELSEKQAAIACANGQLQQQQERYIKLQNKAVAEKIGAAAAAATQSEHYEKVAQQLQAQLDKAQAGEEGLQSMCDAQGRQVEGLTAELTAAKTSVKKLQVSVASHLCKGCS